MFSIVSRIKKDLGFSAKISQMGLTISLVPLGFVLFPFVGEGNTCILVELTEEDGLLSNILARLKKVLICGSGISLASSFSNEAVFDLHEHYL